MAFMMALNGALRCYGLTLSKLPDKGKSLFTTKEFSPGDVIITEEPYVCVPLNSGGEHRCYACFESPEDIKWKTCSRCKIVYYCNKNCQASDWKLHKLECKSFSDVDRVMLLHVPLFRLSIRLLCRLKLQSAKEIPTCAMDNPDLVNALMHIPKHRDRYSQSATLVNDVLEWADPAEFEKHMNRMFCNCFKIFASDLTLLGEGLYPVISFMNHSCVPNCIVVFEGRKAVVRALQHVPKGAEVLISYIEPLGSTETRKKELEKQYDFSCTCPRCIKEGQYTEDDAFLNDYKCTENGCDGLLSSANDDDDEFICQRCGHLKSKKDIKEMETKIESLQEKAHRAERSTCSASSFQELIATYKAIEALQKKLFTSRCIYFFKTWEYIIAISEKLEDWREALKYCKLCIALYQEILHLDCYPSLGLHYYDCGKFERLLGETKNAVKSVTNAFNILKIPYGTTTPFMKEVISTLEELEYLIQIEALTSLSLEAFTE